MSSPTSASSSSLLAISSADFLPRGSSPFFFSGLRKRVQNLAKRALAGAVAEKAVVVLQFDIEAVDLHRWQPGGAVAGDARGCDDVFCHVAPALPDFAVTTAGEPIGFTGGAWRVATATACDGLKIRPKSLNFGRFLGLFALTHGIQRL